MTSVPDIIVASRETAETLLLSRTFLGVISIRDPGSTRPKGLATVPRLLELQFEDILRPSPSCSDPPSEDHVRRIVEFGQDLRDQSGTVLVHCEKGQSRSAATAIILLALWLGPGRELEAVQRGFEVLGRPWASPFLLDLADSVLGRGGALCRAFTEARSEL